MHLVQDNRNASSHAAATGRLPGMKPELKRLYDGLRAQGATGPASGRTVQVLSKNLHLPRNRLVEGLEHLEGMGVVGHQTAGHETTWYTRK